MPAFRADLLSEKHTRRLSVLRWLGLSLSIFIFGLAFSSFLAWRHFFADIPTLPEDLDQLWAMERTVSLVLLDQDGTQLATRGPHYGRAIKIADLPTFVPQAFLAIEDQQYFSHRGVDTRAIARAAFANLKSGRTVQGGSTITQQLVKLLLLSPQQTFKRKLQEVLLATQLEKRLGKTEILELYLNRVYFGSGAYGVDAAARRYFSKPATELTLPEAAILAGLPKAPSRLAPNQNRVQAQARADLVLRNMQIAGYISAEQAANALAAPPELHLHASPSEYGYAFDLIAADAQSLVGNGTKDLVITATIDPKLQSLAETVLAEQLAANGKTLNVAQGAMVILNPKGAILALVGGRSYEDSKFNRAVQAKRQPGSAFKPFVYAAALESGVDFDATRYDEPVEIDGWEPQNYGGGFRGRMTLRDAFKRSVNTIAAQLTDQITPAAVARLGKRFGIEQNLAPLPSIALGAQEVNLLALTRAYSVFANDGLLHPTFLINRLENTKGDVLYDRPEVQPVQVYDPALARQMTSLMQEVVLAGTGRRAALFGGWQAAGKTGTSQDWRDAWFVGFTGEYIIGVWVGNDDNTPMKRVTGGGLPAQIWQKVMSRALEGRPLKALNAPPPNLRSESDETLAAYYLSLIEAFGTAAEASNEALIAENNAN